MSTAPRSPRTASASSPRVSDRTARVWNAATGQQLAKLEGHTGEVTSAAFSPDGQRIVTASWDETARVWNAATGQQVAKLEGHTGPVTSAAFSPDGQHIVTASWDKTARVWNAATGQQVAKLEGHTGEVNSARSPRTASASSPRAQIRRPGSGTRPLGSCWQAGRPYRRCQQRRVLPGRPAHRHREHG